MNASLTSRRICWRIRKCTSWMYFMSGRMCPDPMANSVSQHKAARVRIAVCWGRESSPACGRRGWRIELIELGLQSEWLQATS